MTELFLGKKSLISVMTMVVLTPLSIFTTVKMNKVENFILYKSHLDKSYKNSTILFLYNYVHLSIPSISRLDA